MSTTERPQGQIEETFSGLMEASPDAIVIVDREGRIVLVNRHTETLFGYGRGELIGAPVEVLVPEARRPPHAAQRESYQHEPHRRPMGSGLELSGRRKDGSEFPVGISLSPVQSGGEQLITAAVRDTTAQTSTERALKLAIRELEAFTYSVSHDLRAPIRQIDGFARLLEERHGAGLEPEGLHYLNRILEGAQHMGRLVDSLLGLARIGQQDIRPIWVALDDIVQAVVEQLKSESEGREVVWRVEPLPEALCDAGLMKIAFTNLLSNALKYTRPRARAEIDIGHRVRDGVRTIVIRDNGVGFDMQYADKLFGVFQRLHRAEEFEGQGVGLATVQRIVHKHEGEIWAESEPDAGATFFVALQLRGPHEVA